MQGFAVIVVTVGGRSMIPRSEIALLGDIGATNARFAILADGVLGAVQWFEVARYAQLADAIGDFFHTETRQR
jgi:glucokinase